MVEQGKRHIYVDISQCSKSYMAGVFHTTSGMGPGPLELEILVAFCLDWEF
jgi:hypothetical protein